MADNEVKKGETNYDRFKEFRGSRYAGMKIGGSHKWYYDQGEWRERKFTPDEWDISYQTTKRRAGHAPEGSGAPVGTEYNWLIVAHQRVKKIDANTYSTCLEGKKFKVAHKRASKEKWNIYEVNQRKKVIQHLQGLIQYLEELGPDDIDTYTVGGHKRIYGLEHKNLKELNTIARELGIGKRSRMKRQELLGAIKISLAEEADASPDTATKPVRKRKTPAATRATNLKSKTRQELYKMAKQRNIKGRSEMKKQELLKVLS